MFEINAPVQLECIEMYDVGTKPSSTLGGCLLTRVQPSPWSCSMISSCSPSYIGIEPSLVAVILNYDDTVLLQKLINCL